ncbi:MAG: hypothetical protein FWF33_00635 [Clostridiales bacterium]|nr:hypothetical protein [Clostridiales bacterium]
MKVVSKATYIRQLAENFKIQQISQEEYSRQIAYAFSQPYIEHDTGDDVDDEIAAMQGLVNDGVIWEADFIKQRELISALSSAQLKEAKAELKAKEKEEYNAAKAAEKEERDAARDAKKEERDAAKNAKKELDAAKKERDNELRRLMAKPRDPDSPAAQWEKEAAARVKVEKRAEAMDQLRVWDEQKQEKRQAKLDSMLQRGMLMEPIGSLPGNLNVILSYDDTGLRITDAHKKSDIAVVVPYSKITFVRYYSTTEIKKEIEYQQKNKSVVGRGIGGGILFGPVGAIVGGMSGLGTKTKVKKTKTKITDYYFIVNYRPQPDQNPQVIAFEMDKSMSMKKFEEELMNKATAAGGIQTVTTL